MKNQSKRRVPAVTVLVASSVFFLASSLWILNLAVALNQVFDVGGRWSDYLSRIPYLARVDISTVTTLVLVLTSFAVLRGVVRLDKAKRDGSNASLQWRVHFPFHPGFRTLLVQLGLMGTIFAFIVAFSELSSAGSSYDPAVLIAPLGTALWSTFAGISFAFLVVPVVERVFEHSMGAELPPSEPSEEVNALRISFEGLVRRLEGASDGLGAVQGLLASLEGQLARLDEAFDGSAFERLTKVGGKVGRGLDRVSGDAGALSRALAEANRHLGDFPQLLTPVAVQVGGLAGRLNHQASRVEGLSTSLEGVERQVDRSSADLATLLSELQVSRIGANDLRSSVAELTEELRDLNARLTGPPGWVREGARQRSQRFGPG